MDDVFEAYRQYFDADVFVSYAHRDDDQIGRERQGWVSQFHEDLISQIRVYLGGDARVWRDNDIRNNDDFERKIAHRLARTATLLSVVSASFVNSEWCLREVKEFAAHAEELFGMHVDGEKKRLFKVERIPTDRAILPEELLGTTTYRFFVDGKRPLRPNISDRDGETYYSQLVDLAIDITDVMRRLAEMAKHGAHPGPALLPAPTLSSAEGRVVYVAEATMDLDDHLAEVRRDLKDRGFVVLPEGDLPRRARDYRTKVEGLLARAELSVHLVGNDFGFIPEGEARKSNLWIQHEIALERSKAPDFQQIVWIGGDAASDARQEEFLDYLRTDPEATARAEMLEGGLEELKTEIHDALAKLERARRVAAEKPKPPTLPAPAEAASDDPLCIYIICDPADRQDPQFVALRRHLLALGHEPMLPLAGESDADMIEDHREKLASCDASIIYYGAGSPRWFAAKLNDFRKILRNRPKAVLAKAIYIAAPITMDKQEVETNEARVLLAGDSFQPATIEPFVARLGGSSA